MIVFKGPRREDYTYTNRCALSRLCIVEYGRFLNKSYLCFKCDKGFNTDDFHHHSCKAKKSLACHRVNCPDFSRDEKPSQTWERCHRAFYRDDYYYMSQLYPIEKSICQTFEKCTECCKIIEHHGKKRKKNGPTEVMEGLQRSNIDVVWPNVMPVQNLWNLAERLTNQEEALDEEDLAFKDPPVFVYADYEAMQESDGEYFPIMVCCETDEEDYNHTFYGEECYIVAIMFHISGVFWTEKSPIRVNPISI